MILTKLAQGKVTALLKRFLIIALFGVGFTLLNLLPTHAQETANDFLRPLPLDVFVLSDNSGSVSTTDPNRLRADALQYLRDYLNEHGQAFGVNHRLGLARFSNDVGGDWIPLTGVQSISSERLTEFFAVESDGDTHFIPAFDFSLAELRDSLDTSRIPVIILVTDGRPRVGRDFSEPEMDDYFAQLDETIAALRKDGIEVFVVGIGDAGDDQVRWEQILPPNHYRSITSFDELIPTYRGFLADLIGLETAAFVTLGEAETHIEYAEPFLEQITFTIIKDNTNITAKIIDPGGSIYQLPEGRSPGSVYEIYTIPQPISGGWQITVEGGQAELFVDRLFPIVLLNADRLIQGAGKQFEIRAELVSRRLQPIPLADQFLFLDIYLQDVLIDTHQFDLADLNFFVAIIKAPYEPETYDLRPRLQAWGQNIRVSAETLPVTVRPVPTIIEFAVGNSDTAWFLNELIPVVIEIDNAEQIRPAVLPIEVSIVDLFSGHRVRTLQLTKTSTDARVTIYESTFSLENVGPYKVVISFANLSIDGIPFSETFEKTFDIIQPVIAIPSVPAPTNTPEVIAAVSPIPPLVEPTQQPEAIAQPDVNTLGRWLVILVAVVLVGGVVAWAWPRRGIYGQRQHRGYRGLSWIRGWFDLSWIRGWFDPSLQRVHQNLSEAEMHLQAEQFDEAEKDFIHVITELQIHREGDSDLLDQAFAGLASTFRKQALSPEKIVVRLAKILNKSDDQLTYERVVKIIAENKFQESKSSLHLAYALLEKNTQGFPKLINAYVDHRWSLGAVFRYLYDATDAFGGNFEALPVSSSLNKVVDAVEKADLPHETIQSLIKFYRLLANTETKRQPNGFDLDYEQVSEAIREFGPPQLFALLSNNKVEALFRGMPQTQPSTPEGWDGIVKKIGLALQSIQHPQSPEEKKQHDQYKHLLETKILERQLDKWREYATLRKDFLAGRIIHPIRVGKLSIEIYPSLDPFFQEERLTRNGWYILIPAILYNTFGRQISNLEIKPRLDGMNSNRSLLLDAELRTVEPGQALIVNYEPTVNSEQKLGFALSYKIALDDRLQTEIAKDFVVMGYNHEERTTNLNNQLKELVIAKQTGELQRELDETVFVLGNPIKPEDMARLDNNNIDQRINQLGLDSIELNARLITIQGLRQTGKTTLLWSILHKAQASRKYLVVKLDLMRDQDSEFTRFLINGDSTALQEAGRLYFWQLIGKRLQIAIQNELPDQWHEIPEPFRENLKSSNLHEVVQAVTSFVDFIHQNPAIKRQLFLAIDEADLFYYLGESKSGKLSELDRLISQLLTFCHDTKPVLCIVHDNKDVEWAMQLTEEFIGAGIGEHTPILTELMGEETTHRLLSRSGLILSDMARRSAWAYTGGHVALTQFLAIELTRRKTKQLQLNKKNNSKQKVLPLVTVAEVKDVIFNFTHNPLDVFEYMEHSFSAKELFLLHLLAKEYTITRSGLLRGIQINGVEWDVTEPILKLFNEKYEEEIHDNAELVRLLSSLVYKGILNYLDLNSIYRLRWRIGWFYVYLNELAYSDSSIN